MTRPGTIIGALLNSRWVAHAWLRRGIFAALAVVLAILCIWPRPYEASALLAPDDSAAGLTGMFSGVNGANLISSLLGGRGTIEADLLVGRSNVVFSTVAKKLQEQGRYPGMSPERLQARLHRRVEVESARGSILQITVKDYDQDLARQIIEDFVVVLRERLTNLSREQADAKKAIVSKRMDDAIRLLQEAQEILNSYRAAHNFSTPVVQQAFSQGNLTALQGQLQGARATLLALERTVGPNNVQLQTSRDRIQILQRQIADLQTRQGAGGIQSLAKVNPEVAEYMALMRNEGFAQARYDIYKRYLESLTVQDVAAPLSVAVVDPPFIDPQRHYNAVPLGLLTLLIVLAVATEFYVGSESGFAITARRSPAGDGEPSATGPGAATPHP